MGGRMKYRQAERRIHRQVGKTTKRPTEVTGTTNVKSHIKVKR
jgi:hypothetical protein